MISQTNIEEPQDTLTAAVVYARDKERQVQFLSSQSDSALHFLLELSTADFVNTLDHEWLADWLTAD